MPRRNTPKRTPSRKSAQPGEKPRKTRSHSRKRTVEEEEERTLRGYRRPGRGPNGESSN